MTSLTSVLYILSAEVSIVHVSGSERVDVSANGTFFMTRNSYHVLECVLEGVEEHSYPVEWTVPTKPNGEPRPGVEVCGATLKFTRSLDEQEGTYTCNITGITATVSIVVTSTYQCSTVLTIPQ